VLKKNRRFKKSRAKRGSEYMEMKNTVRGGGTEVKESRKDEERKEEYDEKKTHTHPFLFLFFFLPFWSSAGA
jgi:hypothetical protein